MSLYTEFLKNDHRTVGKWMHYFTIYERHFARFKNQYVTLFEVGTAGGGSLQLWKRYFGPFVKIVGIDINPLCKQVEEDQIEVRIGSQADPAFLASLVAEFGAPDIVIDDGSHVQEHINITFDALFASVTKNGVYLVEDLHTAYWDEFGGGLRCPTSFIERAKGMVDLINANHTRGALAATALGNRIASLHFYDSVAVVEVGEKRTHFDRWIGNTPAWREDWTG